MRVGYPFDAKRRWRMKFGVPREKHSKYQEERRVGLSPAGAAELIRAGATVFVESKAGIDAGFTDEDYRKVGAQVVYSAEEAYRRADIVVKVQAPAVDELQYIRQGLTIMGFLHMAVAPQEVAQHFVENQVTAIGYEVIQRQDGVLPVLKPMSMIAGRMAVQIAGRLLEAHRTGGRGILLGGIPGLPPAEVVIIGAGNLGLYATESFIGIGARVILVDKNPDKLEHAIRLFDGKVTTMLYSRHSIEKLIKFADVLILSVLVPGQRAPIIITKEMVKTMKKGAVIMDFSIDQGGACETSRLTPTESQVYTYEGVVHFAVPNVPSWVSRTSTHALTNALLPYLLEIQQTGLTGALKRFYDLKQGVYIYKGKIVKQKISTPGQMLYDFDALLTEEA